jgi:uncharacterized protein YciI
MLPTWTIRCICGDGALERREAALAAHEAYLVAHSRAICFAGPMFADDGETRTGLWLMIEAADRAGAEAFIAGEGFNRAGMFGAIEIRRFMAAGPDARRQVEIAPDPACEMFICEWVGAPEVSKVVAAASERGRVPPADRSIVAGAIVTDDGSRRLGTVAIVEAADRAAAVALLAADPSVRAGTYAEIGVDRWRFGKSVV